jgi:hypothetical protein
MAATTAVATIEERGDPDPNGEAKEGSFVELNLRSEVGKDDALFGGGVWGGFGLFVHGKESIHPGF